MLSTHGGMVGTHGGCAEYSQRVWWIHTRGMVSTRVGCAEHTRGVRKSLLWLLCLDNTRFPTARAHAPHPVTPPGSSDSAVLLEQCTEQAAATRQAWPAPRFWHRTQNSVDGQQCQREENCERPVPRDFPRYSCVYNFTGVTQLWEGTKQTTARVAPAATANRPGEAWWGDGGGVQTDQQLLF